MRILEVKTEHVSPFKVLIEVLKDMLPEVNIEFRYDNIKSQVEEIESDDENDEDSDDEIIDSDDEVTEEEIKSKKNKKDSKVVDKSGMRIMAVDTTKTVLINLRLDANNFTKFKCKKKKLTLGVNLAYFYKLIKSVEKEDTLTLYVDHDDKNYLKIKIDSENLKDSLVKLKLLDLAEDPMTVPDITFDAVVTMSSSEFHKICREMNQIADYVEIKCLSNKIIFTCKGDSAEKSTTYRTGGEALDGDCINIKHALSDKKDAPIIVQGIYELRNLVLFSKCASLCNDIEIYMKNNYPLVIKYTVATLGRILLCLTPINEENANYSDEDEFYSDDDIELLEEFL